MINSPVNRYITRLGPLPDHIKEGAGDNSRHESLTRQVIAFSNLMNNMSLRLNL